MTSVTSIRRFLFLSAVILLAGCQSGTTAGYMGAVKDPQSGLMFGSVVRGNTITDSAFFKNKRIKVRIRNTSGDTAFNLKRFRSTLETAYRDIGFVPTRTDDFGLMINLNVKYSGQIQTNMANEYAFLGAATGALYGNRSQTQDGAVIGAVSGATLGSILGSFVTDDTYIVIAEVTFATIKNATKREGRTITFSRSISGHVEDEEDLEEYRRAKKLKRTITHRVAVFAGGGNISQSEIAEQVRQRMIRIVSDII